MKLIPGGKRQKAQRQPVDDLPLDPVASAKVAGLHYVSGGGPGIQRKRRGKSFQYVGPDGQPVRDEATLERIRLLVIPPAWENVWICPSANGHLQAVGVDAKGRKQYRYHAAYRKVRNETKFSRMLAFGAALPKIRERVEHDLRQHHLNKTKVLATVVKLMDQTCIRVGNDEYARDNESYGLTTMHDEHVDIHGGKIHFHFRGKSGQTHDIDVNDKQLARIVKQCRDIDGFELFQYFNAAGEHCRITSTDVNAYLHSITGEHFTAKDFRTWHGTGSMAGLLKELGPATSDTDAKRKILAAVKKTAEKLGNRPATCRNYYIHPAVLDLYVDQTLFTVMAEPLSGLTVGLREAEHYVLRIVESHRSRGAQAGVLDRFFGRKKKTAA